VEIYKIEMCPLMGNILSFIIDNIKIIYFIIGIIIFIEGIIYLLVPNTVRRTLIGMPIFLWRILGMIMILAGVFLFYLYKRFLYMVL